MSSVSASFHVFNYFTWIHSILIRSISNLALTVHQLYISYSVTNANRASTEGAATIHAVRVSKSNLYIASARIVTIIFYPMSNRTDHENSYIAHMWLRDYSRLAILNDCVHFGCMMRVEGENDVSISAPKRISTFWFWISRLKVRAVYIHIYEYFCIFVRTRSYHFGFTEKSALNCSGEYFQI